jgi:hypothetical protein
VPDVEPVLKLLNEWEEDELLPLDKLVGKVLLLLVLFRSLRFREMETIKRSSWVYDASKGVGSFLLIKKLDVAFSRLEIFDTEWAKLSVAKSFDILLKRTDGFIDSVMEDTFVKEDGSVYSYNEMRALIQGVLDEAGTASKQPYQLKRAGLSALWRAGTRIQEISAHARHSFKTTTTLRHYISFDGGRANTQSIAESVLGKDKERK